MLTKFWVAQKFSLKKTFNTVIKLIINSLGLMTFKKIEYREWK
jgi:hypothetical protein